ncbi:MAG: hypothetical protein Q9193_004452, partial [Seirophora villosa]
MRLDVKRQLLARSERVKGIDFHPTEPWILTTLYSGHVYIWSYETQAIVKTFELTDVPVRAGRFIARKNWIVCGSDDFQVRVYNYNTSEKITSFEAHPDYIRAVVVHPTQSFVLTASDDMTIKLWDWDKGWKCVQVYEGHSHYVMGLAINPKDTNTFASACLDRTVKIWSFGSGHANYTLEAHETKGVNHVDYYPQADKPYLLTTSDDQTVKIWDYTTKSMIATLEGHTSNVSFACYHPELPVIISGSEDGTVKIWHANTYRLEQSLSYGLERAWCVSYQRGKQGVAVGFDDGAVVVKMGREEPAVSMDSSGKLIWARHSEVLSSVIKGGDVSIKDGTPLSLPAKELGNCEIYPQTLQHSPNGRFVSVCGDGEYIIYTALAWRNKAFGSAQDFAWGSKDNSNDYAIRESSMSVRIFRNFKEKGGGIDVGFQAEGLSGGVLLGVRGQGGIGLFDWETGALVRRIEVEPKNVSNAIGRFSRLLTIVYQVYWSESGELVTLACDETFYVLRFSRENYVSALQAGQVEDDGVESAFEVVTDINESVRTGQWVGDCFIYTNSTNRLNYLVGDQTYTVSHFDQPMYLLGYLPRDGRAYIADKDVSVTSFALSLRVVEYQTLVLRGDLDTAAELLEDIPADQKNKIARFLEGQGYKEMALEVATDPEHRFDLALGLNKLAIALEIAKEAKAEHRWKTVGDAALAAWDMVLAEECFVNAKDLGSLLLVYTATGNAAGLRDLANQADEAAAFNITFSCLWQSGDIDGCIEILLKTGKTAEAVLFSQTYKPSRCRDVVGQWKEGLEKNGKAKLSRTIGVPPSSGEGDEELFPEWDEWLRLEEEGIKNGGSLIDLSDGPGEDGVDGVEGEGGEKSIDAAKAEEKDAGAAIVPHHAVAIDKAAERRVLRKIDLFLIPVMWMGYGLVYYDKAILGSAVLFGMTEDLSLRVVDRTTTPPTTSTDRLSWATSMFYFGMLAGLYPLTFLLQRFVMGNVLGGVVILWGLVAMLTAAVTSWQGLFAQRFFLGFVESIMPTAFMCIITNYYTQEEQALRQSWWFSATGGWTIIGGALNYAFAQITGGTLRRWQYIYLLAGALTVLYGCLCFLIPNSAVSAWFLTEEERVIAVERLRKGQTGVRCQTLKWSQLKESILDVKIWLVAFMMAAAYTVNGAVSGFGPLIVSTFGYTPLHAILLQFPLGFLVVVFILLTGYLSSRIPNIRLALLIACCLPVIAGCAMIWRSTWYRRAPTPVAGYTIIGFFGPVVSLIISIGMANVAGATKKSFTAAAIFVAYCVGNIVGPQLIKTQTLNRHYPALWLGLIICYCIVILLAAALYLLLARENKRRDALALDEAGRDTHAFRDLTDKENP